MIADRMKTEIVGQAQELYVKINTLYNSADKPDYNDLVTIETYLNIILRMIEEVQ